VSARIKPGQDKEELRAHLIELCERAIVPESKWSDRDTPRSQERIGVAWAFLKAGCDFRMADDPKATDDTLWVEISHKTFNSFEMGEGYEEEELFYIPTDARLRRTEGRDWY
jgi:hypothetical protein